MKFCKTGIMLYLNIITLKSLVDLCNCLLSVRYLVVGLRFIIFIKKQNNMQVYFSHMVVKKLFMKSLLEDILE